MIKHKSTAICLSSPSFTLAMAANKSGPARGYEEHSAAGSKAHEPPNGLGCESRDGVGRKKICRL
jgi:hypothetical protein